MEQKELQYIPPVFGPMTRMPSHFVSSVRTTACDIMCTTNSALPEVKHLPPPPGEASLMATLPYEKIGQLPSTGQRKASTLFQKFRSGENIERHNVELRKEREDFMLKLFTDKKERDNKLFNAAVKIQKIFRGYRSRPRKYGYIPRRKRKKVLSQNELHDALCEMAGKLDLKPIPGLNLESRVKASKRKQKIENAAAFIIQRFFRMIFQRGLAMIVVKTRKVEQINKAACIITRAIRFLKTKNFIKRAESVKKGRSSVKIQCAYRRWRAYLRVRAIRKKHIEMRIKNDAATIIQRNFSSKSRGEISFARATLLTIRSCKRMYRIAFEEATNYIINEIIDTEVREYVPKLHNMLENTTSLALLQVSSDVVEDAWFEACNEFILVRLREIEEERRRVEEERLQVEESLLMSSEEHLMRSFMANVEAQRKEAELAMERHTNYLVKTTVDKIIVGYLDGILEKRVAEYALQRYKEEILHEIEERKRIEVLRKKTFEDFVRDSAESFVHIALEKHVNGIVYKAEVEQMILDIANKIANDSINAAVSICSDSYSLYARELASLNDVTVLPSMLESQYTASVAESVIEPENSMDLQQPTLSDPNFTTAVESQIAEQLDGVQEAVGEDIDSLQDENEGNDQASVDSATHSERRQVVSNHVKDTAELFARGKYQDAIGGLNPVIAELQGIMEHLQSSDTTTGKEIKFKILISVSRLLKARALQALGYYEDCKVELDQVLLDREMALGNSSYLVAEVSLYLAEWYRGIGNYLEAENFLKKADDIMMEELALTEKDKDGSRVISSTFFKLLHRVKIAKCELLRNLGQYYKSQESLKQVQRSLARYKILGLISFEVQEEFHVCYINSIILRGKYSNALTLHKELLEKRRGHYGNRHPKIASSLDAIGRLHLARSDIGEAAKCLEESMVMRYEIYPADHPAIAASHLSKAEAFCLLGRFEDAFVEATRSLQLFHQKFGALNHFHPSIARVLIVLSRIHVNLGEPSLAMQAADDSLKIFRACWGITELHRRTMDGLDALAESYIAQKAFLKACDTLKEVITKRDTLHQLFGSKGGIPHELALSKFLLAYSEVHSIPTTSAVIDHMKEQTKLISQVTGNRHALIARCLFLLSEVCKLKGGHADAKSYIGFAYDMIVELQGEEHPFVPLILAECADNLRIPGFYSEAMELCDNAMHLAQKVLRVEQNTLLAQVLLVKGQILSDLGRFREAEDVLLHSMNMVLSKGGECAFYGIVIGQLAELYRRKRKIAMAERNFVVALQIGQVQCGLQSMAFLEMAMNYALLLMDMKQWFQAFEILHRDVEPQVLATLGQGHIWTLFVQANASVCTQIDEVLNGEGSVSLLKGLKGEESISEETILSQSFQHSSVQNFMTVWKQAGFGEDHPWYNRFKEVQSFIVGESDLQSDAQDGQSVGFSMASYPSVRHGSTAQGHNKSHYVRGDDTSSWVSGTLEASDADNESLPSYDGTSSTFSKGGRSPRGSRPGRDANSVDQSSQSESMFPNESSQYSASAALSAVLSVSKASSYPSGEAPPSGRSANDSTTNSHTYVQSSGGSVSILPPSLRGIIGRQQDSQFSYYNSSYNSVSQSARSNLTPRSLVSYADSQERTHASSYFSPGEFESPRSVYTGKSGYVSMTPSTVRSRLNNLEDSRTSVPLESSMESSLVDGSSMESVSRRDDVQSTSRELSGRRRDSFTEYLNTDAADDGSEHSDDYADDDHSRSYASYASESLRSDRGEDRSLRSDRSRSRSQSRSPRNPVFESPGSVERSNIDDYDSLGSPSLENDRKNEEEETIPSPRQYE